MPADAGIETREARPAGFKARPTTRLRRGVAPDMIANLRITARLIAMLVALLIALPLHGLWRLLRQRSPWPPIFLGWIARIVGARTRIVGTPLPRDVLYLANHMSWLDILVIAGASGSAFVAKGELEDVPVIGWLSTLNHTVFVDRGDRLGVARQVDMLRDALAADHPVTIFPEGTTDGAGVRLLPFKAALLGAVDPPAPGLMVQPVHVDYGAATRDIAWIGDDPGLANALRVLGRPGRIAVTLTFLAPFDPAGMGRKAVAARARDAIAAVMRAG
ncbi:1-acyl-sn-glycerol-3-phosphate acyltransferase [Sphingomonas donggukensis]|uniref:1-acyl-sn-glycerol-3-phosphate acyltransferase n=1 Tax=Sphingomonas donggukensis TaxID=2949093 RepID=A0ABY4TTI1_9SPHN|nr:lysophospholipid acyltransferase family protein [Sphingomonas donggukensis]URW75145.1 1-acyl-sn-glycerol-3-phosphate acyltransferase [Sphingomonas donggukensis]